MQIRKTSYSDYGLTEDEVKYIKLFCKNATDEEVERIIKPAVNEIGDSYIEDKILKSLTTGMSHYIISKKEYLLLSDTDFYAYKRKAIEAVKRWMILYGILEV